MNDVDKMLMKQFLLRVRQEGYSLVENPPQWLDGINIDIYRGKTKICTFDDRQLGERWNLRVRTDDSTRPEIKADYHKLFYMFIDLRDLYMVYDAAEPLRGYDQTLGYRAIMEHNNCVLAVRGGNIHGEIEFGTFIIGSHYNGYSTNRSITRNIYFDMDAYPLARLDFVSRSGLLPNEQLVTPDNIKYLRVSCEKTMAREGDFFDDDTKVALGQVIRDLEKAEDSFREVDYCISAMSAKIPTYIDAKILAVNGIFTKHQIDRATLPKGVYAYDIQYSKGDILPESVWPRVIGRRFGTVITKKPLEIEEKGYIELGENGFALNPDKRSTLKEFQGKHRDHER